MGDLRAAPVVGPSGRGSAPPSRPNDLNSTTKITHSIFFYPSVSTFTSAAIKAALSEKGISQTWLAKQLGKSFSMVNAYACNRIQPNLDTLQQIAEILQVDLKDLITDQKDR